MILKIPLVKLGKVPSNAGAHWASFSSSPRVPRVPRGDGAGAERSPFQTAEVLPAFVPPFLCLKPPLSSGMRGGVCRGAGAGRRVQTSANPSASLAFGPLIC